MTHTFLVCASLIPWLYICSHGRPNSADWAWPPVSSSQVSVCMRFPRMPCYFIYGVKLKNMVRIPIEYGQQRACYIIEQISDRVFLNVLYGISVGVACTLLQIDQDTTKCWVHTHYHQVIQSTFTTRWSKAGPWAMFGFLCRLADNNKHCKEIPNIHDDKNTYNLCLENLADLLTTASSLQRCTAREYQA